MLKQIAWNTFKNTGDINTMIELIEVDKAMKNTGIINNREIDLYGNNKNKGNNTCTKQYE